MEPTLAETVQSDAHKLLEAAAERAIRYVDGIINRRVSPAEAEVAALHEFHEAFSDTPSDPREVIAKLDEIGSPATVATTAGRYFGFVNGGMLPAALAANWLAGAWNQNAALRVMSPVAAELEDVVLRWVCELLGLPKDCAGGLVTCATMANFTALVTARHALLARVGWNVTEDGMFGAPPIEVVVGAEAHASILKALSLAGFETKRVTIVEADGQGRMRAEKLPRLSGRTIVCIQAGNVNTGAFDPRRRVLSKGPCTGRLGARRWRVRFVGPCIAEVRTSHSRIGAGRFMGDRCTQMAQRRVRQWPGHCERRRGAAGLDGHKGCVSRTRLAPGADASYAGSIAARAGSGVVGGAEVARPVWAARVDRAFVCPCAAIRARAPKGGLRRAE
jgi:Pyridoxal-dependent decarboxylase conserved domain